MQNILLLACFLLTFAISACTKKSNPDTKDLSKVTVLYGGDERIFLQDYFGMEASFMMFLPLAKQEGDVGGEPVPMLANKWEHSEDYREWTFYLNENITWHDGMPVTAHDIEFHN